MITLKLFQQIFYLAIPLVLLERQRPNSRSWKKRKYQITKYKSRVRLRNFNWNVILFFSEMEGKKITHILARFSLVKWILIPSHSKSLKSAIFFIKKEKLLCLVTLSLELRFPIHKIVLSTILKQNMKVYLLLKGF